MTTATIKKSTAPAVLAPYTAKEWEKIEVRHAKLYARMNTICKRDIMTQKDGVLFAIDVLKLLRDAGADVTSACPSYRENGQTTYLRRGPQSLLFWRALDEISRCFRPAQVGFAIVFTDFLGAALGGAVPDPEFYDREENARRIERWNLNEHDMPCGDDYVRSAVARPAHDDHKTGRKLAIDMIEAMETGDPDDNPDAIWASHKPRPKGVMQNNVTAPFLAKLARMSPEAVRGFASILTDQMYVRMHVGDPGSGGDSPRYHEQERDGDLGDKPGTAAYED